MYPDFLISPVVSSFIYFSSSIANISRDFTSESRISISFLLDSNFNVNRRSNKLNVNNSSNYNNTARYEGSVGAQGEK